MERELFKVLEQSIERHGKDKVLTLGHLYNILKLAQERAEIRAEQVHKKFHYIVCRWLQEQGASCVR